jgi:hypothetical protein
MEVIMGSFEISLIVFAVIFGGSITGMLLRRVLPKHHLSSESTDVIKLGMGMIATMAALVLGLLVASAKASYDAQRTELTQASAHVVLLDQLLALYGPETSAIRESLQRTVVHVLDVVWSENRPGSNQFGAASMGKEALYVKIQSLTPQNDLQRSLRSQSLAIALNLGQTRWLLYEQESTSVSKPLVVVMVFWLAVIFISWGLYATPNATLAVTMFIAALSVSSAIFLMLGMYTPYQGLIRISDAPLRAALAQLGQ